jgi:PAT family beta-lactamase induction signal transducer AmpG
MSEESAPRPSRPWRFVPPLYLQQGTQYFLVQTATGAFLKSMGAGEGLIGRAATLITLPWQAKALWSPLVDLFGRRRSWILAAQLVVLAGAVLLALAPTQAAWFAWTIAACGLIGVAAATHDIALDGFYLRALDQRQQSAFVGVRNTCFRLGRLVASGALVYAAGKLETHGLERTQAWRWAFAGGALVYALMLAVSALVLPRPAQDRALVAPGARRAGDFLDALGSYLAQPRLIAFLAFIFLYRLGESMLTPMLAPFLLADGAHGGMGLLTEQVGLAYGTVGVIALLAGGLLGGFVLARHGLRRWLWPMALTMHLPNLALWWMASARPGLAAVYGVVALEQAAYGFGFSAYMVVLMQVSRRSVWSTSHYAISTGLMGLAALLAGYWSGDLVESLATPASSRWWRPAPCRACACCPSCRSRRVRHECVARHAPGTALRSAHDRPVPGRAARASGRPARAAGRAPRPGALRAALARALAGVAARLARPVRPAAPAGQRLQRPARTARTSSCAAAASSSSSASASRPRRTCCRARTASSSIPATTRSTSSAACTPSRRRS